ncbi:hypothetical protein [Azospirillum argentinense]|uniref:hypothetical protein n=1 Tax=Azospirillum argentinense TaxID=2970906 RepID=UPI0032DEC835
MKALNSPPVAHASDSAEAREARRAEFMELLSGLSIDSLRKLLPVARKLVADHAAEQAGNRGAQ